MIRVRDLEPSDEPGGGWIARCTGEGCPAQFRTSAPEHGPVQTVHRLFDAGWFYLDGWRCPEHAPEWTEPPDRDVGRPR